MKIRIAHPMDDQTSVVSPSGKVFQLGWWHYLGHANVPFPSTAVCDLCEGSGNGSDAPCEMCGGEGHIYAIHCTAKRRRIVAFHNLQAAA